MADITNEYADVWEYLSTHTLKDVTSEIATLVNNVKSLQAQGKYEEAANIVRAYDLKEYIMCSDYINAIDEKTRNLEVEFKEKSQGIYYQSDEPSTMLVGDVWIG